ncbi:hypothetical protein GCM10010836_07830 [Aminobacter aminovorans]
MRAHAARQRYAVLADGKAKVEDDEIEGLVGQRTPHRTPVMGADDGVTFAGQEFFQKAAQPTIVIDNENA